MNRSYQAFLMSSLILGFALGSVGCEKQGPEQAGDRVGESKPAASANAAKAGVFIDDTVITAKIEAALLADPVAQASQIRVATTGGVVTLIGEVDSQATIDRSQAIASGIVNFELVRNVLVVNAAE
jgi:hyperosmotically inducible protein